MCYRFSAFFAVAGMLTAIGMNLCFALRSSSQVSGMAPAAQVYISQSRMVEMWTEYLRTDFETDLALNLAEARAEFLAQWNFSQNVPCNTNGGSHAKAIDIENKNTKDA